MHTADREVRLTHLLCQPFGLLSLVAEDDRLRDGQSVIQVAQCLKLELFSLDSHEKLLDALKCEFIPLH